MTLTIVLEAKDKEIAPLADRIHTYLKGNPNYIDSNLILDVNSGNQEATLYCQVDDIRQASIDEQKTEGIGFVQNTIQRAVASFLYYDYLSLGKGDQ